MPNVAAVNRTSTNNARWQRNLRPSSFCRMEMDGLSIEIFNRHRSGDLDRIFLEQAFRSYRVNRLDFGISCWVMRGLDLLKPFDGVLLLIAIDQRVMRRAQQDQIRKAVSLFICLALVIP